MKYLSIELLFINLDLNKSLKELPEIIKVSEKCIFCSNVGLLL